MRAIVVEQCGGPEVMQLREWTRVAPGPGEILVEVTVAGVNFMDTATRSGTGARRTIPFVPGVEGAGIVTAVGADVDGLMVGARVAWPYAFGSYAEQVVLAASAAVEIPHEISDDVAAAAMMQSLTAHHLVTEAARVEAGTSALVHAAGGGVGQVVTQLLKLRGVRVIGLVSRADKIAAAERAGADSVVVSTGGQFVGEVLELTDGHGVDAVFDGGGETTFGPSLQITRRNGTVLYYGAAIGESPIVRVRELPRSVKVCFPRFLDRIPTREHLVRHSTDIFDLLADGKLTVDISHRYALADAAQAHADLESRATTGKLLLIP